MASRLPFVPPNLLVRIFSLEMKEKPSFSHILIVSGSSILHVRRGTHPLYIGHSTQFYAPSGFFHFVVLFSLITFQVELPCGVAQCLNQWQPPHFHEVLEHLFKKMLHILDSSVARPTLCDTPYCVCHNTTITTIIIKPLTSNIAA
jgi:hypothetical protein